jgi:hypothetical protein
MRPLNFIVEFALAVSSIAALAQDSARTVQYHSQDIVPIRARKVEIYDPYRTTHHRENHGSRQG